MHRTDGTSILTGLVLSAVLLAVSLSAGCGYRSQLTGGHPPSGSEGPSATDPSSDARATTRIAVIGLSNDSPEPWLDRIVTASMRRELESRGAFRFVNDPNRAELVVRGRIRELETEARSFSRFVSALEFGVTLRLDLEVVLASGDVVRLDSSTLSESDVYLASPDVEVTRTNRLEALRRLSDLLASRVADSIALIDSPIPRQPEAEALAGGSG